MGVPTSIPVSIGLLRYQGVVNIEGLFQSVRGWLGGQRYDIAESSMKHKVGADGIKKEYEWKATKDINEYVQQNVTITFIIANIIEVEMIRKGVKQKLTTCRLQIKIDPVLVLDYKKRFNGKFLTIIHDFYREYIIKKDIFFIWADNYYYHMLKFQTFIKNYLDMESKYSAK